MSITCNDVVSLTDALLGLQAGASLAAVAAFAWSGRLLPREDASYRSGRTRRGATIPLVPLRLIFTDAGRSSLPKRFLIARRLGECLFVLAALSILIELSALRCLCP